MGQSFREYLKSLGINTWGIPYTKYWLEWDTGYRSLGSVVGAKLVYEPTEPMLTRTKYLMLRIDIFEWHLEISINWRS